MTQEIAGSNPVSYLIVDDRCDDVQELLSLLGLEAGYRGNIKDAEFNASFKTGLELSFVIGLDGGEFFFPEDGFVVEDAIEFKCEPEGRDEDVEF